MIIEGGPFVAVFAALPPECKLPWMSGLGQAANKKRPSARKIRLTCPATGGGGQADHVRGSELRQWAWSSGQ
jgi:hypothetical protein